MIPQKITKDIKLSLRDGLHLRPAQKLSELAGRYRAQIFIHCNGQMADAKSPLALLTLELIGTCEITVTAEGPEAEEAMASIEKFLLNELK